MRAKAVRDKIPEKIRSSGKVPVTMTANSTLFLMYLEAKLDEELSEYKKDKSVDELADLVEVVYAILKIKGVSIEEFEDFRLAKRRVAGGFDNNQILSAILDGDTEESNHKTNVEKGSKCNG